jgi:hypothetical protein
MESAESFQSLGIRFGLNQPRLRPQHIADLFKPRAKGIVEQVGVALRGLNLSVAKKLADHRQRHAARNEQRREGVPQIMDADGGQIRLRPDIFPEPLDVLKRLAFGIARKHPFAIFGHARPDRQRAGSDGRRARRTAARFPRLRDSDPGALQHSGRSQRRDCRRGCASGRSS